jgi:hypothetical protein
MRCFITHGWSIYFHYEGKPMYPLFLPINQNSKVSARLQIFNQLQRRAAGWREDGGAQSMKKLLWKIVGKEDLNKDDRDLISLLGGPQQSSMLNVQLFDVDCWAMLHIICEKYNDTSVSNRVYDEVVKHVPMVPVQTMSAVASAATQLPRNRGISLFRARTKGVDSAAAAAGSASAGERQPAERRPSATLTALEGPALAHARLFLLTQPSRVQFSSTCDALEPKAGALGAWELYARLSNKYGACDALSPEERRSLKAWIQGGMGINALTLLPNEGYLSVIEKVSFLQHFDGLIRADDNKPTSTIAKCLAPLQLDALIMIGVGCQQNDLSQSTIDLIAHVGVHWINSVIKTSPSSSNNESFLSRVASWLTIPGILDDPAVNELVMAQINVVGNLSPAALFPELFKGLVKADGTLVCRAASLEKLFQLDVVNNLRFLEQPAAASSSSAQAACAACATADETLNAIFASGNRVLIERVLQANSVLPGRPLYAALTKLDEYSPVMKAAVKKMLGQADFDMGNYLTAATAAFDSLACVVTEKAELDQESRPGVSAGGYLGMLVAMKANTYAFPQRPTVFSARGIFQFFVRTDKEVLFDLAAGADSGFGKNEMQYRYHKIVKKIHEIMKRALSPEDRAKLLAYPGYAAVSFAYRIQKYKKVEQRRPSVKAGSSQAPAVRPKEIKRFVLNHILNDIILRNPTTDWNKKDAAAKRTNPYLDYLLTQFKADMPGVTIPDANAFFDQVLVGEKTRLTLLTLDVVLLAEVLAGTRHTPETLWNDAFPGVPYSNMSARERGEMICQKADEVSVTTQVGRGMRDSVKAVGKLFQRAEEKPTVSQPGSSMQALAGKMLARREAEAAGVYDSSDDGSAFSTDDEADAASAGGGGAMAALHRLSVAFTGSSSSAVKGGAAAPAGQI